MRTISEIWPRDLAILEIDPSAAQLATDLDACGYNNYLAVVPTPARLQQIASQNPALSERLAVYHISKIVRQNNAAVLILHRQTAWNLALFRPVRHARFVAFELRPTPACLLAMLIGLVQYGIGRLRFPIVFRVGTKGSSRLIVFPVRKPRPHDAARRFIPHHFQIDGFLRPLLAEKVPHAVLRWFESLPNIEPGEDLDLLVDDDQLGLVREMLSSGVGIQPVDLYSASGIAKSDYRGRPYFPPHAAKELLANAAVNQNLCRVPRAREHFLSLAYHAVYHKGIRSGLPECEGAKPPRQNSEHDYRTVLSDLANRLGIVVPITLVDLDSFLAEHGWRPPRETLVRLAQYNPWLQRRLRSTHDVADAPARLLKSA